MTPSLLVFSYGITIVASAIIGGYLPQVMRMNHVRMQVILSFVGGMMLGVAVLQLLPHGFLEVQEYVDQTIRLPADERVSTKELVSPTVSITMRAMLIGLLFTFFMMRAFHFHQHGEVKGDAHQHEHDHATHDGQEHAGHGHDGHDHAPHDPASETPTSKLAWVGVMFGLGLHTFVDGVALGASVLHDTQAGFGASWAPAGFGVYLAILLHKPLDALSVATLMDAAGKPWRTIQCVNASFGLICLVGALAAIYLPPLAAGGFWLGCLLAGSAGVFLCISLSDLLPEVQFHRHDRLQLSAALLLGIGVAFAIEFLHHHT